MNKDISKIRACQEKSKIILGDTPKNFSDISSNIYDISKIVNKSAIKLSDYIRQVMTDKDLNMLDVQRNSRGRISYGYVNDLLQEKTVNPSVDKLKALAQGLGVSEEELFRVARGLPIEHSDEYNARVSKIVEFLNYLPEPAQDLLLKITETLTNHYISEEEYPGSIKIQNPKAPHLWDKTQGMKSKPTEEELKKIEEHKLKVKKQSKTILKKGKSNEGQSTRKKTANGES